jgi:uncharacterized RDD family membrane protein YckC
VGPTTRSTRPKASFGQRFGAALLDTLIFVVLGFILEMFLERQPAQLVGFLAGLGYYIALEGSGTGQTLGKKVLGIRVVDLTGAGPIGYGRATVRYFGRFISGIPIGLGYFWMLWDDQRQTWHDKFANSMVVPESAYPIRSSAG